jgi:hypothetical protein
VYRQWTIPDRMLVGLERYIRDGTPVGQFLQEVLSNNLQFAVGFADDDNLVNLPAYCAYLHNEAPAECHGSAAKYRDWILKHERDGSDEDDTEIKFRLTHVAWDDLAGAIDLIDGFVSGQGPDAAARWLASAQPDQRLRFVGAAAALAEFVEEKVTKHKTP